MFEKYELKSSIENGNRDKVYQGLTDPQGFLINSVLKRERHKAVLFCFSKKLYPHMLVTRVILRKKVQAILIHAYALGF